MLKQEFDSYIDKYRPNLDNQLWLSGESSTFFAKYKANKLKEWFPELVLQKQKILDFGCGDGVMTNFTSDIFKNAEVYGVDPSPKSIEEAQETFTHIKFTVNSDQTTQIDYPDNTFDLIFVAGAFHHIPFSMHQGYVQELNRIAKPNGKIIIFELNPLNPLTVFTFKRNPIDQNATMLKPWYGKKLGKKFGKTKVNFYCFFPRMLRRLRFFEKYLTKLPIGALYAIIISK